MESAVQFMMGISFVILGISFLWRQGDWISWLEGVMSKGRRGSLTVGVAALTLGAFIVGFHPVWQGIPLLLTLFGLLAIVKGATNVLFPGWLPDKLERNAPHFRLFLKIKAVLLMALGVALLAQIERTL